MAEQNTVAPEDDDEEEEVFNIDADIENADWLRSMYWDLPLEPEKVFVIICGTYGTVEDQKANWEHFLTLPAAKPMPPEVKVGVEAYLAQGGAAALPEPEFPVEPPVAEVAEAPAAPVAAAPKPAVKAEPKKKADWRTFNKPRTPKR